MNEPNDHRPPPEVLLLDQIHTLIDGRRILDAITWSIRADEQWVVLGPNGGGKSTLLAIAGLRRHPSGGRVTVLGHELGRSDIRPLRARISTSSAGFARSLRPAINALDVVRCGASGALETWWHQEQPGETDRARSLLEVVGLGELGSRSFGTLSSGEQQRCLLARALMPDPSLLLLDEPNAGLDLAGREQLIASLEGLAADKSAPATVLVTHHVEDIPRSTTHLLALRHGRILSSGPIEELLSAELLSELFGLGVELSRAGQRWQARGHYSPTSL